MRPRASKRFTHRSERHVIVISDAIEDFVPEMTVYEHSINTRAELTGSIRLVSCSGPERRTVGGFDAVQYQIEGFFQQTRVKYPAYHRRRTPRLSSGARVGPVHALRPSLVRATAQRLQRAPRHRDRVTGRIRCTATSATCNSCLAVPKCIRSRLAVRGAQFAVRGWQFAGGQFAGRGLDRLAAAAAERPLSRTANCEPRPAGIRHLNEPKASAVLKGWRPSRGQPTAGSMCEPHERCELREGYSGPEETRTARRPCCKPPRLGSV